MVKRNRQPTQPGVILKKYYLESRQLSISQFATATGMSRKHISHVVHGRASISPDAAYRFSVVLDTTAEFWLNLQNAIDLYEARRKLASWRPQEVHPAVALSP